VPLCAAVLAACSAHNKRGTSNYLGNLDLLSQIPKSALSMYNQQQQPKLDYNLLLDASRVGSIRRTRRRLLLKGTLLLIVGSSTLYASFSAAGVRVLKSLARSSFGDRWSNPVYIVVILVGALVLLAGVLRLLNAYSTVVPELGDKLAKLTPHQIQLLGANGSPSASQFSAQAVPDSYSARYAIPTPELLRTGGGAGNSGLRYRSPYPRATALGTPASAGNGSRSAQAQSSAAQRSLALEARDVPQLLGVCVHTQCICSTVHT
jgi:hypothetical protein